MSRSKLPLRRSYDAIVVGARCAGAATAMLLAKRGLRVLAVDRAPYASDTLSTHALMRGAVLQLHRWGLLPAIRSAGTPAIRSTTFHYGDATVEVPIKPRDGVDALYAPRRTLLDALLVDAARASGAEVLHGLGLAGLLRGDGGRVRGVELAHASGVRTVAEAPLVVGADGVASTVAKLVGARAYREAAHATTMAYAYWRGLEPGGYRWFYRTGASAGLIPTNDGLTCVFVAVPPSRGDALRAGERERAYLGAVRDAAPDVARDLADATRDGAIRVFPGTRRFVRQAWGEGWALVGDAGFFRDPITAHGITDALRDAELLAAAAARGTEEALADYEGTRDELSLGFFDATDAIASFDWDLASVARLHRTLSEHMAQEVAMLAELAGTSAPRERERAAG